MKPRRHLVIMARVPRLGAVKRRLARDVGDLAAWRFYRATLAALLRRVGHDPRWTTLVAITPDRAAGGFPCSLRIVGQGHGDLGRRMERLLHTLPPGPVVIVGSDIPDLGATHVAAAFDRLARADWVFGRADDGGYWLVGARRRRPPYRPFAGVRWSSAYALADTVANLNGQRIAYLHVLSDIDTGADLTRWRHRS